MAGSSSTQQPNRIRDFEQEHGEIDLHDISKLCQTISRTVVSRCG